MHKPILLWTAAGIVGIVVIIVVVVVATLRSQSRIYTADGTVDLSHPQPTALLVPVGESAPPIRIALTPTLKTTDDNPVVNEPVATLPLAATFTPILQPTLQPAAPIFYDDFADLSSGWAPLFLDRNGNFNGYSVGGYHFDAGQPDALLYDIENRMRMSAGRYEVDIRYEDGIGTFGLLLGVQGDLSRFDTLTYINIGLTEQGSIIVYRRELGSEQIIAETPPNPNLLSGQQTLHFAMDVSDGGLIVLVNDTAALRTSGIQIQNGYVGLFARSNGRPLHVGFDNLVVLAQPSVEQAACASIRPLFAVAAGQPADGDDVQLLRRRLIHLGYMADQGNGPFDQALAAAVTQFQTRNGLQPNSVVDGLGWCRLLSDAAIRADTGRTERAEEQQVARPVQFNATALTTLLALSVRQVDQTWRVALALPDKSELLYLRLDGDALDPTLSPDAHTLAFTSNRSGRGAVWLLDLQSGALRQLTPDDQECQFPAWSPDSRMLVVTCEPLDHAPLAARDFVIDIASGRRQQLSNEHAGWADWSMTNEIVYTHWTGKSFDLVRTNPDGSGVTPLLNTDDIDEDIAGWSPDGSQIAFVANPRGKPDQRQIFLMRRDGSEVTPLTTMSGPNSNPIWSPDGQAIVFSNQNGTRFQPWILRAGDSQPQQLSANDDRIWFMNWLRLGP